MRMNAYYYSFTPTGVEAIDKILSAVATAGKAYHHTDSWAEPDEKGMSEVDRIQAAAVEAAEAFKQRG